MLFHVNKLNILHLHTFLYNFINYRLCHQIMSKVTKNKINQTLISKVKVLEIKFTKTY